MKNKIRIKTNNGDIVFDHSREEIHQIDSTREAIFLWADGDFSRGYTNGFIEDGDILIFTAPDQDAEYFSMLASRLIAWTYRRL